MQNNLVIWSTFYALYNCISICFNMIINNFLYSYFGKWPVCSCTRELEARIKITVYGDLVMVVKVSSGIPIPTVTRTYERFV